MTEMARVEAEYEHWFDGKRVKDRLRSSSNQKKRRETNRDAENEKARLWAQSNKDKIKAAQDKFKSENREILRQRNREYEKKRGPRARRRGDA